jgi:hypothetical protein
MSKPKHVKFRFAEWLKEKGFDIPCREGWYIAQLDPYKGQLSHDDTGCKHEIEKPEQHQVVDWLLEKHGIWIQVCISRYGIFYCNVLQNQPTKNIDVPMSYEMICQLNDFDTPQKAYEAAFDYIKDNNLI